MKKTYDPLTCPCGLSAITVIVGIPACESCHDKYSTEGRRNLPFEDRPVFKKFIDLARGKGYPQAINVTFYRY